MPEHEQGGEGEGEEGGRGEGQPAVGQHRVGEGGVERGQGGGGEGGQGVHGVKEGRHGVHASLPTLESAIGLLTSPRPHTLRDQGIPQIRRSLMRLVFLETRTV